MYFYSVSNFDIYNNTVQKNNWLPLDNFIRGYADDNPNLRYK